MSDQPTERIVYLAVKLTNPCPAAVETPSGVAILAAAMRGISTLPGHTESWGVPDAGPALRKLTEERNALMAANHRLACELDRLRREGS